MSNRSWKLLEILKETSSFFLRRGLENPRLQAELLLADVLRLRRVDLYLQFERLLTNSEVDAYREYVRQRVQGRPLQYITGSTGFRELVLEVDEGVLIPRPETEEVAGAVLQLLAAVQAPRLLDLGCGTGAIGLSVACENPAAQVVMVDLAPAAVANTRRNAARVGLEGRVQVLQGDLFQALAAEGILAEFAVIVSNPPYIPSADIASLQPEVRDYEPHLALDGGSDGLGVHRRILAEAATYLMPKGYLILELGIGQDEALRGLIEADAETGLEVVEIRPDLRGVPRVLIARCGDI